MGNRYWPMFDIRLTTPDLELRHLTEDDLGSLAAIIPGDAEQDPSSTSYPDLGPDRSRGVVAHQEYSRARGNWRPEAWALSFGVFRDGELLGYQGLEGDDFAALRTVDSSSFLTGAVRGQGLGKQMRAAVLALAFGALGARFAITSAWSDKRKYQESLRQLEEAGLWPHPDGLEIHVFFGSEGSLRVSEIWDSQEQFGAFGAQLLPILNEIGIEFSGDPEILEVHNISKR